MGYTYERICKLPRWQADLVLKSPVPSTPKVRA